MTPLIFALALAAQHEPSPAAQAIARTIDQALPAREYDWPLNWSAFGARTGRDIRWTLSEPGADQRGAQASGVYRRTGWIAEHGATISATVCGDDTNVRVLTLFVDEGQIDKGSDRADVIAPLQTLGVRATERSRQEAVIPDGAHGSYRNRLTSVPARIVWRLEREGRSDAVLTVDHVCTPPGTASMTQCWRRFTVDFRPDHAPPIACPAPGRYGG